MVISCYCFRDSSRLKFYRSSKLLLGQRLRIKLLDQVLLDNRVILTLLFTRLRELESILVPSMQRSWKECLRRHLLLNLEKDMSMESMQWLKTLRPCNILPVEVEMVL